MVRSLSGIPRTAGVLPYAGFRGSGRVGQIDQPLKLGGGCWSATRINYVFSLYCWGVFGNRIYSPVHYRWDISIHKDRRDIDYAYPIILKNYLVHNLLY